MKYNPYSVSKLGTYKQCPKKFYFNYILKPNIPRDKSIALYRGTFMHLVLENNFDYNIDFELNSIFTLEEKNKCIRILEIFRKSEIGKFYEKLIPISILEEDFAFKILKSKIVLCDYKDKEAFCRGSADLYKVLENKVIEIEINSLDDIPSGYELIDIIEE